MDLRDIRKLSKSDLQTWFEEQGEKKFRANQIHEWLWKKDARSFHEMTNISKETRDLLETHFSINKLSNFKSNKSKDGTVKCAFKLFDDHLVEGVLIPTPARTTACISSQVGCSLDCDFCATGKLKRIRNLDSWEIYEQVFLLNEMSESEHNRKLSNIVYMGMGEPLLNYSNVLESIDMISSNSGLGMSPKRVTVSTAGIGKMIYKLGEDKVRFNLALSLHAANDEKRSRIMSINESNSIDILKSAIKSFHANTGTRITYEYVMLNGFNDSIEDAKELSEFCKITPCKINLIEYNSTDDGKYKKSSRETVQEFVNSLESKNLIVNVRRSRGQDIDAACGQLANKLDRSKMSSSS